MHRGVIMCAAAVVIAVDVRSGVKDVEKLHGCSMFVQNRRS